jgi:predicted RNase H-like HicB family nuclease
MNIKLTAVFQKVTEGYIGFVEELPGANTQGNTLEEARANLEEAVILVLEANREAEESLKGKEAIRELLFVSALRNGVTWFVAWRHTAVNCYGKVRSLCLYKSCPSDNFCYSPSSRDKRLSCPEDLP